MEIPFCASPEDFAPGFTAEAYLQGQNLAVELKRYRGRWVILFFYPSDFTPV
jgi:alkyl hydroperoxide reductase subunit AhpC